MAQEWLVCVYHVMVQMLEYEMATNAEKLKSIVDQGKEMAAAGHFDSAAILRAVQDFDRRLHFIALHKFVKSFVDQFVDVSPTAAAFIAARCRCEVCNKLL